MVLHRIFQDGNIRAFQKFSKKEIEFSLKSENKEFENPLCCLYYQHLSHLSNFHKTYFWFAGDFSIAQNTKIPASLKMEKSIVFLWDELNKIFNEDHVLLMKIKDTDREKPVLFQMSRMIVREMLFLFDDIKLLVNLIKTDQTLNGQFSLCLDQAKKTQNKLLNVVLSFIDVFQKGMRAENCEKEILFKTNTTDGLVFCKLFSVSPSCLDCGNAYVL
ncbi:hypothetical protein EIN_371540 [Entamoeba invadens IP1]|uniref:Uncharacterized protein n=1 Tax=Entamoeba invadens IP1 TaxID=370355 RepID=A0A0A1UGK2_ENTIV|nr:hypothetical protein EIN_371540 [Entamoeba invadens IP1]ELP92742.1 hypothetical protein EIN_371540 [Entamoeba invadens IP1]|eukprot:XP_004259513.1 hypothetical protein EIN_371540 [Entamoeba invadens IP1]